MDGDGGGESGGGATAGAPTGSSRYTPLGGISGGGASGGRGYGADGVGMRHGGTRMRRPIPLPTGFRFPRPCSQRTWLLGHHAPQDSAAGDGSRLRPPGGKGLRSL